MLGDSVLKRYARIIRWCSLAVIVIALLASARAFPMDRLMGNLRQRIEDLGFLGPLSFLLVYALTTVLVLPCSPVTVVGGAVFGLLWGTLLAAVGATLGATLALLVSRHVVREKVFHLSKGYSRFAAIDQAIGKEGWKVVGLLRLSPVVPFNLINYLIGLTAIGIWPYTVATFVFILPGTFMYVYLGYLGGRGLETASAGQFAGTWMEWALLLSGLVATVAVTLYVTRLAREAIRKQTQLEESHGLSGEESPDSPVSTALAVTAAALFALAALWIVYHRESLATMFGLL